jgi:pimeloyl-ACP methyl ester carboxylesterase
MPRPRLPQREEEQVPFIDLPDTRLFYTDQGEGPPLVLVHGWTCDSTDWTWALPALLEHFRVIAYDQRGEGRSGSAGDHSMARQVDDLLGVIEHVGCAAPIVMGHSLGGAIASSLAVERPGVARAVVVLDPPYAAEPEVAALADGMKPALQSEAAGETVKAFFGAIGYTEQSPEWLKVLVERRIDALSPDVLHASFVSMWDHTGSIARRPAADAYLSRRDCPVLAIHSTRQMSDYEQSTFRDPRSRAIDWPGTGHWVQVERPAELAAALLDWVTGVLDPTDAGSPGPASQGVEA